MSNSNMYNITDYEVSAESVLLNHGGVEDKDLVKLVTNKPNKDDDYDDDDDDDDNDEIDTMSYSPYFCPAAYQTT